MTFIKSIWDRPSITIGTNVGKSWRDIEITRESKVNYVNKKLDATWVGDLDDKGVGFCYKAVHDYGLDSSIDIDEVAWLNTLIGYDIGIKEARAIANAWYEDTDGSVLEIDYRDKKLVWAYTKRCGLDIDFSKWATETPEGIRYDW